MVGCGLGGVPLAWADADGLLVTDCAAKGQIYDAAIRGCVADPDAKSKTGATTVMLPLLGVQGDVIDDDVLAETVGDMIEKYKMDPQTGDITEKKKGAEANSDDTCSNGVYFDGCEDGTQRMCSLIVEDTPAARTHALWWPVVLWGIAGLARCLSGRVK